MLKKYGFKDKNISFVPTSAFMGVNLISRDSQPPELKEWYGSDKRPDEEPRCLLECIEVFRPSPKKKLATKPIRACIYDYYSKPPDGFSNLKGDILTLKVI